MMSIRKTLTATVALLAILAIAAPSFARGGAGQGATNSGARMSRTPTPLPYTYTPPAYDYTPPSYSYTPPGAVVPPAPAQ